MWGASCGAPFPQHTALALLIGTAMEALGAMVAPEILRPCGPGCIGARLGPDALSQTGARARRRQLLTPLREGEPR
jgi:hypothetical protein